MWIFPIGHSCYRLFRHYMNAALLWSPDSTNNSGQQAACDVDPLKWNLHDRVFSTFVDEHINLEFCLVNHKRVAGLLKKIYCCLSFSGGIFFVNKFLIWKKYLIHWISSSFTKYIFCPFSHSGWCYLHPDGLWAAQWFCRSGPDRPDGPDEPRLGHAVQGAAQSLVHSFSPLLFTYTLLFPS